MRRQRQAFSLMEMMLALAIAMVLLLALYLTLSTQVTHSQEGRDVVAEAALARNILMLIANDITGQLGAPDPRSQPDYAAATAKLTGATPPEPVESTAVVFNACVRGENNWLTLSAMRVQKARIVPQGKTDTTGGINNDMRRISYWVVANGEKSSGLARYENNRLTADDLDMEPSELPDQEKHIIAKEVKAITFEYHNGAGWDTGWTGRETTEEGSLYGPPVAVKITITLKRKLDPNAPDQNDEGRKYTHIVSIPAGNNFPMQK